MTRAERALVELVTETRARLESDPLDALADDRGFVAAFEARLRAEVLAVLDAPLQPAQLAALERAALALREIGARPEFDRFAHWRRHAAHARLVHALELVLDELRYTLAAAHHQGACDCAITRTLVAERRQPNTDRLQRVDDDDLDGDSFVSRARYVCGHCGTVWTWCSSDYPGDPIGGVSWSVER